MQELNTTNETISLACGMLNTCGKFLWAETCVSTCCPGGQARSLKAQPSWSFSPCFLAHICYPVRNRREVPYKQGPKQSLHEDH